MLNIGYVAMIQTVLINIQDMNLSHKGKINIPKNEEKSLAQGEGKTGSGLLSCMIS